MTKRLLSILCIANALAWKAAGHETTALDNVSALTETDADAANPANPALELSLKSNSSALVSHSSNKMAYEELCVKCNCSDYDFVQPVNVACEEQKRLEECKMKAAAKSKCDQCTKEKQAACGGGSNCNCDTSSGSKGRGRRGGSSSSSSSDDDPTKNPDHFANDPRFLSTKKMN